MTIREFLNRKNSILLVIAAIIFFSCDSAVSGDSRPNTDSADIKQIIDRKNAQFEVWYREGKVDSLAQHFADNVVQMPPNQPPIRGLEQYKKTWSESMQYGTWNFDLKAQEVKTCGDMAVELGKFSLSFNPNANSPIPPISDKGHYVALWEKIDGEWKIVWDAPVSELPPGSPQSQ